MQIFMRALALCPVIILALVASAAAQAAPVKLPTGTWTGTVTPPNEATVAVSVEVVDSASTLALTINAQGIGSFKADGIKVEADRLVFSFVPGPVVTCTLMRKEDLSYAGNCVDEGGAAATMVIMPPNKPS